MKIVSDLSIVTLKKPVHTTDIKGKLLILGCGTSVGVPTLGCGCPVCIGGDPKNRRTRSSVIFGLDEGNLLIDTTPDLHVQLLREKIGLVNAVVYTHEHADHIFGMDDLRLFQFYLGHPVPVVCNEVVERKLKLVFDYAFGDREQTHIGAVPSVDVQRIGNTSFEILGVTVTPIPLNHGPRFEVLGFRIGNIAYCTDCKSIPETSIPLLQNLDVLVISALRPDSHPTHMNIEEAIKTADQLQPKRTILTHMSCKVDYQTISATLPPNVELGFDGMQIPLS